MIENAGGNRWPNPKAPLIAMIYSAKLNDRSAKQLETTTKVVARATVVLAFFTGALALLAYLQLIYAGN